MWFLLFTRAEQRGKWEWWGEMTLRGIGVRKKELRKEAGPLAIVRGRERGVKAQRL